MYISDPPSHRVKLFDAFYLKLISNCQILRNLFIAIGGENLPPMLVPEFEQLHSLIERLRPSLGQMSFSSFMVVIKLFFVYRNLKSKNVI